MNLKQPLMIATLATALALGAASRNAEAADPLLGALIGGGIGAAIGHDINRHNGGAVGGIIGAVIGSSIAADSNRYYSYDDGYYGERYYAPPVRYYGYAPAPVYVGPAYGTVVYRSSPRYAYSHQRSGRDFGRGHRHR